MGQGDNKHFLSLLRSLWGGGVQGFREPMGSLHRLPMISPSLTGLISATEKDGCQLKGLVGWRLRGWCIIGTGLVDGVATLWPIKRTVPADGTRYPERSG